MKFRTDFVTNSSSVCFITEHIDNPKYDAFIRGLKLKKEPECYDDSEWGPSYVNWFKSISEWDLWELIDCEGIVYEEEGDNEIFTDYKREILEALVKAGAIILDEGEDVEHWYMERGEHELTDVVHSLDQGIKQAEINHAKFGEGERRDFEYIRVANGRRLLITVCGNKEYRQDMLMYRNEIINGMEFVMADGDYQDKEAIITYMQSNGARLSEIITDNTRYVICPVPDKQIEVMEARDRCVPVLSEQAFRYRYLNEGNDRELETEAWTVGFRDVTVREWFEKTGFGQAEIQEWKEGEWQSVFRE